MKAISRYLRRELLPLLADLRLAIVLLLVIAIACATGTFIEQGETLQYYQANYPESPARFGFLTWKVLLALSLNRVYQATWFLSLLVLFGSSLAACTVTRQWPMLKVARRWSYYKRPASFKKFALSASLDSRNLDDFERVLIQQRYLTFREGDKLYARKGIAGKIGPIVVHARMLLVLAGAIWGSLSGYKVQEMIPTGTISPIRNAIEMGSLAKGSLPDWQVKVNRFWIDYADDGRVKQFYSDLSVLDGGEEVKRKTIFVNQPLKYKGVTLYQADWSVDSAVVRINRSPAFRLPLQPLRQPGGNKLWGTFVPTKPDMSEGLTLLVPDFQGTALVYGKDGNLVGPVRAGGSIDVEGQTIYLDDLIGATGLQIKSDPGIPVVYVGFGLLMLGVMMSYVSHSQIWALQVGSELYVGGKTNRALVLFEREFYRLLDRIDPAAVSSVGEISPQSTSIPQES